MREWRGELRNFLFRLFGFGSLLVALAVVFGEPITRTAIPPMQAWLELVDRSYVSVRLESRQEGRELMIHREVTPRHPHVLGPRQRIVMPGTLIETNVSAGLLLQTLVLGLALACAWPVRRGWREIGIRLVVASVLLAVAVALDVPLLLYAFAWNSEQSAVDPEARSLLVYWGDFLQLGGRYALAIGAAAGATAAGRRASGGVF